MKFKMMMVCVLALAVFPACGKSHLNDEQKAELKAVVHSAGNAQRAVPQHGTASLRDGGVSSSSQDVVVASMTSRLQSSHCDIDFKDKTSSVPGTPPIWAHAEHRPMGSTIKVGGNGCPISMSMDLDMSMSMSGMSFAIDLSYSVSDDEYRKLNDVDAMTMKGSFNVTASGDHASGKADMKGNIHSQARGNVSVTSTGTMENSEGELVTTFVFPDFTAELKQKSEGDKTTYYINDEEVSAEEYSSYLVEGGPAFQGAAATNSSSN